MIRDLVALGGMIVGFLALTFLAVALAASDEWGQLGLLIGGVLFAGGGAMTAQWDPQQVAAARARRLGARAARRATRDAQDRTGRVQMPRLPRDEG